MRCILVESDPQFWRRNSFAYFETFSVGPGRYSRMKQFENFFFVALQKAGRLARTKSNGQAIQGCGPAVSFVAPANTYSRSAVDYAWLVPLVNQTSPFSIHCPVLPHLPLPPPFLSLNDLSVLVPIPWDLEKQQAPLHRPWDRRAVG